jgi:hypothetical protein
MLTNIKANFTMVATAVRLTVGLQIVITDVVGGRICI